MTTNAGDIPANVKDLGQDFRRYLERGKFIEEMTKALLTLYTEREWPTNPNEYICKKLAENCNVSLQQDTIELKMAKEKIKELENTVVKLKEELSKCKQEKVSKKGKD